jgi:GT2 family glycosyltransferase
MVRTLIQCVVVLHKQSPIQARSLVSLLQICGDDPSIAAKIKVLIQDNSPESQLHDLDRYSASIDYYHAPTNPGLAAAYNRALGMARRSQIQWLLTLDQDTVLDRNFILQLLEAVQSEISGEACAFVPELVKEGLVLSPQIVRKFFYHRLPVGFCGFTTEPLVAFNSAACLNVEALVAIGGFPEEYWLDYLDHVIFYRLQTAGGRVYVLNSQLAHSLSLQSMESEVSTERYSNILAAEWRFIRETGSRGGSLIHRMRLFRRAAMHAVKLTDKSYAIQTMLAAMNNFNTKGRSGR